MVIRETWKGRRLQCKRMLKAAVKHPVLVTRLPLVGLCEVWCHDSDAWVFPGSGGVLRMDWSFLMRYVRRHR